MKKMNNNRLATKRRQRAAAKDKARKKMTREVAREYMAMRRMAGGQLSMPSSPDGEDVVPGDVPLLSIDDTVKLPVCDGVGECCKDRFLPLDPSDVWRILRNEAVREKWGVEYTMDLFGKGKPLLYDIDASTGVPGCATIRTVVDGAGYQACPFLVMSDPDGCEPEGDFVCMLGDDRPTFCKSDPITRHSKSDSGRRHAGWAYVQNDGPCGSCLHCDSRDEREISVEQFLVSSGMEERYMFTDLFFGYLAWVRKNAFSTFQLKLAAMLVFDWHRFLIDVTGMDKGDVPWEEPGDPREIFLMARGVLEQVMKSEKPLVPKKMDS